MSKYYNLSCVDPQYTLYQFYAIYVFVFKTTVAGTIFMENVIIIIKYFDTLRNFNILQSCLNIVAIWRDKTA